MPSIVERRRVLEVTYRLQGEDVKLALLRNPGAIIIAGNQTEKSASASLAGYTKDMHPNGVIMFCPSKEAAYQYKKLWGNKYFKKSIIVLAYQEAPYFLNENYPIYVDEMLFLNATMQRKLIEDARFSGAVSSVTNVSSLVLEEVSKRCIQS